MEWLLKKRVKTSGLKETIRVKQEDTETQTKMSFIKEEIEDVKIEEVFSLKQEDTEEQTGWFSFSKMNSFDPH